MNWDSIKYIFQIPLSWYQKIHKRVFNAYGTNFLTVREGYYGGTEIGIDSDGFAAEVNRAVDLSGYVKSVDGQTPDENGNVELSDYYVTLDTDQIITGKKTFENVVNVSNGTAANDASIQVDNSGKLKIEQGTETIVETPKVTIANSTNTGHIDIDSSVPSLELYGHPNGLGGNIDFHTEGSTVDYTSRIIDSANQFAFLTFDRPIFLYSYYQNTSNATGIMIDSANGNYRQLLTNEPARLYSTGADNQIATRGYCRLNFARASELCSYVKSVNNIPPDANGNVELDLIDMEDVEDYVNEQLTDYVQQGELTDYVQQDELTDYVQQDELTDYVQQGELTDYVQQGELTDYVQQDELTDYVQTVDGISPDANGAIDFNLDGNKWMKTDSNGHIATTNETPIALSAGNTGYLYANNGALEFKQDEYVTLSTEQTITGKKRFTQNDVTIVDHSLLVIDTQSASNGTSVSKNGLTINSSTPFIDFSTPGTTANDSYIAMTAASGYRLGIDSPHGIDLDAPANQAKLANHPTDTTTTSKAIATVGYVQNNCVTIDKTQYTPQTTTTPMKVVTNVTWNGTQIVIESKNLTFKNGVLTNITNNTNTTIDTVVFSTT